MQSAIDYTHPKLDNGGFPNSKVIGGYDTGEDKADPMDGNGHATALTIGANVVIQTAATIIFTAPVITFQPGFHAEPGATMTVTQ